MWKREKFPCSYEYVKYRFYSNFNALYSRSKAAESELVSVEFMKSLCMPMLYGLEITDPTLMVLKRSGIFLNSYDVELFCKEKRPTKDSYTVTCCFKFTDSAV